MSSESDTLSGHWHKEVGIAAAHRVPDVGRSFSGGLMHSMQHVLLQLLNGEEWRVGLLAGFLDPDL